MYATRRNANFGAQTKAKAIGKTRRSVMKDTGRVDPAHKLFRDGIIVAGTAYYAFGMATAVRVNPVHGFIQIAHHFDLARQVAVLKLAFWRRVVA